MSQLLARGRTLLSLLLLSTIILQVHAQSPPKTKTPDELARTITSLDSALFDAYNQCDLEKFGTFFIDDVEFYHDQSGVSHGREEVIEAVRKISAAKFAASSFRAPSRFIPCAVTVPSRWVCIVSTSQK